MNSNNIAGFSDRLFRASEFDGRSDHRRQIMIETPSELVAYVLFARAWRKMHPGTVVPSGQNFAAGTNANISNQISTNLGQTSQRILLHHDAV